MTFIAAVVHALAKWSLLLLLIGSTLDSLVYPTERPNIQAWLERWWLRFHGLEWSLLGHAEANAALEYFDRYCGARLFSLRRLNASALIVFSGFIVAAIWTFATITYHQVPPTIAFFLHYEDVTTRLVRAAAVRTGVVVLMVPISLSLTRALCVWVIEEFAGTYSIIGFALLLAAHIALLVWWRPIVDVISELPAYFTMTGGHVMVRPPPDAPVTPQTLQVRDMITWGNCEHYFHGYCIAATFSAVFRNYVDYLANGLRIGFAAVFVGSFVLGLIGRELVARVLFRLAQRRKYYFTLTLGGIAGFMTALDHALQVGIAP